VRDLTQEGARLEASRVATIVATAGVLPAIFVLALLGVLAARSSVAPLAKLEPTSTVVRPNIAIQSVTNMPPPSVLTPIVVPTVPAPTAIPTPSPTSVPKNVWIASYYPNRDFVGTPIVRQESTIYNFWGHAPPLGLPMNNFSVMYSGTWDFAQTTSYLFDLQVDGAARVFVDNNLIIDGYYTGKSRRLFATVAMSVGEHQIRVEYYNAHGPAVLCLQWQAQVFTAWHGRYFNNGNFTGPPAMIRDDYEIKFNWDWSAPDSRINADNFSVIWERVVQLPARGEYRFFIRADDGYRVIVNGNVLGDLNRFVVGPNQSEQSIRLGAGRHKIEVQYVEYSGVAGIVFYWEYVMPSPATRTPPRLCTPPEC
jgi:hypothetical protein